MFKTEYYQNFFSQFQLDDFDQLWNHHIDWFEEPNIRRGGWSGVGKLDLNTTADEFLSVFVKKQKNHGRRTVRHPFSGEPTFRRELDRLEYLERCNIPAPKVVFYDEKTVENTACAILITETLLDYEPLDVLTEHWFNKGNVTREQKRMLLSSVAKSLRRFHQSGLVHRALYPKHIFVKKAGSKPKIALIDLEKARFRKVFWYCAYYDLSALHRHAEHWSRSDYLYFYLAYFEMKQLTKPLKLLCRFILRRSSRP
ncbi:MAG: lipopolysaccharide kinase InaA family protein [Methylophilaceae bacterium]